MKQQNDVNRPSRLGMVDAMVLALAAGAIVSAIEVGTMGTLRWIVPRIMRTGDLFMVLIPLYHAAIFGTLGLILALITRFLPRRAGIRLAATSSAALAAFAILLLALYGTTNQWALAFLALGIGFQTGRIAARHEATLPRRARKLALALAIPLAVLAAGLPSLWRWQESSAHRNLPDAQAGVPNVLLVILDTVRAASLGLYGHIRPTTPNLEVQADRWVVFEQAFSTSPWTLPSHASMFTGLYPHELNADWRIPLDRTTPTLAEAFRGAGYRTAGFVANLNYTSKETGLARGFIHYEDYPLSRMHMRRVTALAYFFDTWRRPVKPGRRSRASKSAARVTENFLTWVGQTGERPFFAFLNYFDAHAPYQAPDSLRRRFPAGSKPQTGYEAAIASLDQEIARLMGALEERGLLENTVVILTSDHGELFGEHNLNGHANSLYVPVLQVPLLVRFDGRTPRGLRVSQPVTLRDLAATVANLANLGASFPGVPLTRFWDSAPEPPTSPLIAHVRKGIRTPPEEPVSWGDMRAIFHESYQLIVNGNGREELFDLSRDPSGLADMSGAGAASNTRAVLRARLDDAFTGADPQARESSRQIATPGPSHPWR